MATAAQYRRAQAAAGQRRAQHPRSRRQLVPIEKWNSAFAAVEALKRLSADAQWLQAARVFHSEITGEVELEAQVIWEGAGASLPSRIDGVTVRVRCLHPANDALA